MLEEGGWTREEIVAPARRGRYETAIREMLEQSQEGVMVAMWFYDEAGELEEWQTFRKEAQHLETEHLEIRVAMRDAEAAFRADPDNEDVKARVEELQRRLEELDRQAPWISSDVSVEIALWGVPHG